MTDNSQFIMPNIVLLRKAVKDVKSNALNLKTEYLKPIKEKCERLNLYISELDGDFTTARANLQVRINNESTSIGGYLQSLGELSEVISSGGLSPEDMQAVIDEENQIKADLKNTVLNVKTLFESTVRSLSGKLVNIQDVRIQSDIFESGKSQMEHRKQSLESDINTLTDQKTSLNKSLEELIQAMNLLRDKNLFETLTDLLPTGDDIDKINEITTMTAPEIEIVKQGLTAFKKWMQGVGEGFKYSRLQQARLEMEAKINNIDGQISQKNQDLDSVKEVLRDVSKMESVDTARNTVVEEVNKALGSFTTFCNNLDTLIAINMYSEIGKLYQDQLQYLNSIIREYGKPI